MFEVIIMYVKDSKIFYTPDELGYVDRGKMKWQGLMLKEHNEALAQLKKLENKKEILPKRKQTESEISQLLFQAYVNSKPIKIQSTLLNKNGELYPDILCMVEGYKHNIIYLKLKDTRQKTCTIDQIRNIEFTTANEWYNKEPTL